MAAVFDGLGVKTPTVKTLMLALVAAVIDLVTSAGVLTDEASDTMMTTRATPDVVLNTELLAWSIAFARFDGADTYLMLLRADFSAEALVESENLSGTLAVPLLKRTSAIRVDVLLIVMYESTMLEMKACNCVQSLCLAADESATKTTSIGPV